MKKIICATCRYRCKDSDCRPGYIRCRIDQGLKMELISRECARHSVIG